MVDEARDWADVAVVFGTRARPPFLKAVVRRTHTHAHTHAGTHLA